MKHMNSPLAERLLHRKNCSSASLPAVLRTALQAGVRRIGLYLGLAVIAAPALAQHPQQAQIMNYVGGHVWPVTGLPRSYYVYPGFWGGVYSNDFLGYQGAVNDPGRTQERFITQFGLNLYDAACFQIALCLTGGAQGRERAAYHTRRLLTQKTIQFNSTRGYTQTNYDGTIVYKYGDARTEFWAPNQKSTYFFRVLSELYSERDPYLAEIMGNAAPYVVWQDWKPVTGENAWCAYIGPLQTAYFQHDGMIPWTDPGLQIGLDMLAGVAAMQNEIGAIYHVPTGVSGKDASEISNENNISMYAALRMLRDVLQNHLAAGNLLKNGNYETEGGFGVNSARHWRYNDPDAHGDFWGSASRENWRSHGNEPGGHIGALRGTWAGAGDFGGWWQDVPTRSGLTNIFSAWFWADNNWSSAAQEMKLEFYNADNYQLAVVTNSIGAIGENWEQRSMQAVSPIDAVWVRVVIGISGAGGSGALQVDDVSMVAAPTPNFAPALASVSNVLSGMDSYINNHMYNATDGVFHTGGNYNFTNHIFTPYKFDGYWIGGPYKGYQPFTGVSSNPVHSYSGTNIYNGNGGVEITLVISPNPGQVNILFPPSAAEYPMTSLGNATYTYTANGYTPGATLTHQIHPIGGLNGTSHTWQVQLTDPPRPYYTETTNLFAVDCQTWMMSVLGADRVDDIVGHEGAAWEIWQRTKNYGGYYYSNSPGVIRGVGFSDINNQSNDIVSAEWSFGAVLMCRNLARDYAAMGRNDLAAKFEDDAESIRTAIEALKVPVTNIVTETLANGQFTYDFNWWQYTTKITNISTGVAYLYANKRYEIPFGWWANPLPSLASTAWSILDDNWFDPFVLGGVDLQKGRLRPSLRVRSGSLPGTVNLESRSARVGRSHQLERSITWPASSWQNEGGLLPAPVWPYIWSNRPAVDAKGIFPIDSDGLRNMKTKKSTTLQRGTKKGKYLYRQLAERIRTDISSGRLKTGEMLPSMDHFAAEFALNKATVRQAINELAASGLVNIIPARGTFVADVDAKPAKNRKALSIGWISSIVDHGKTGRYHTELMDGVRDTVQQIGGHLILFNAEGVPNAQFFRMVHDANLDGALLIGPAHEDPLRHLIGTDFPVVLIDNRVRGKRADCIMVDNENGAYQAVEHLIRLGHRHIALVTGMPEWKVTQDRLAGALAALEDSPVPLPKPVIVQSNFSPEGGFDALTKIIAARPRPTGIFCFNDEMAAGALQALHNHTKLRVPDDMSIVGFDDISWTALMQPPLTTIHVDTRFMGMEAALRLHKLIEDPSYAPSVTLTAPHLVVRQSTGPAPKSAK